MNTHRIAERLLQNSCPSIRSRGLREVFSLRRTDDQAAELQEFILQERAEINLIAADRGI